MPAQCFGLVQRLCSDCCLDDVTNNAECTGRSTDADVDKDVARAILGLKTNSMARRYQIVDSGEKELALQEVHKYLQSVQNTQQHQQKRILKGNYDKTITIRGAGGLHWL